MLRGYFRSALAVMMILIISGVVCGEGLRISNASDNRIQRGSAWGLGGLGNSTGLLNRSFKYDSDMNRSGVGLRGNGPSGLSSGNIGGYTGSAAGRSSSYSQYSGNLGANLRPAGASNTTYAPQKIGNLAPADLGTYKPALDYSKILSAAKQYLKPDVGKYEITSISDISWDRQDTLESRLSSNKKYGMKMGSSIARSDAYMEALVASGYLKAEGINAEDTSRITTLVPKNGGEFSELIRR